MKLKYALAVLLLSCAPSAAQLYGMNAINTGPTGAPASSLLARAAPGNQVSVYATNFTSTAGFLVAYNAIAVPADGALTGSLILECVPIAANGNVSITDQPGPTTNFTIGVVYFLTSATNCFTKTTGTLLGFINAKVQ